MNGLWRAIRKKALVPISILIIKLYQTTLKNHLIWLKMHTTCKSNNITTKLRNIKLYILTATGSCCPKGVSKNTPFVYPLLTLWLPGGHRWLKSHFSDFRFYRKFSVYVIINARSSTRRDPR